MDSSSSGYFPISATFSSYFSIAATFSSSDSAKNSLIFITNPPFTELRFYSPVAAGTEIKDVALDEFGYLPRPIFGIFSFSEHGCLWAHDKPTPELAFFILGKSWAWRGYCSQEYFTYRAYFLSTATTAVYTRLSAFFPLPETSIDRLLAQFFFGFVAHIFWFNEICHITSTE